MQGLVTRINSLASGVLNFNVCCAPEANRDDQLPHSASTDGGSMLRKIPASGNAVGSAQVFNSSGRRRDNDRQNTVLLAGRYSGFLHRAAERGDETMLLAALKIDGDLLEGQDLAGNRALHLAARKGHTKICQILCQVGQSLDSWVRIRAAMLHGCAGAGSAHLPTRTASGCSVLTPAPPACCGGSAAQRWTPQTTPVARRSRRPRTAATPPPRASSRARPRSAPAHRRQRCARTHRCPPGAPPPPPLRLADSDGASVAQ
jgi:hypothetical protein